MYEINENVSLTENIFGDKFNLNKVIPIKI